ncbi:hypothetical protein [Geodermatophilus poikilotrophus]|uniref:DnaJ domain-containing protein n=1 Tax=Geodermatophilus poikilotrophus TaxID=1333667 RepID=A0A1I0HJ56_9ACTN|nr:hypothetical protein [Geodermatophilus poikilotrophus]SET83921.1 hypothetical protein SAMN04488546_3906 [Geodermatophilus poikilotrophus]
MPTPLTPDERRRRRAALRRHHPDLGGDAEEFARTLRAWGARSPAGTPGPAGSEVRFVRRPRGARRLLAWWRRSRSRRSPAHRRVG